MALPPDDDAQGDRSSFSFEDERTGKGLVPEFVRKVAVAGLGALFMTEEGLRGLAGQLKLPKEVLGLVLAQADKTKGDIGRVVSDEIRRFLQSESVKAELVKLLSGTSLEIKAQIRLVPKEGDATSLTTEQKIETRFRAAEPEPRKPKTRRRT